ncbi:mitochondrial peptidyl-tRNA hydrolase [Pseudoneurospora amorphoporcata]|uniref:peptidyl-tRNA hydrolase n=1 Tax=Pseudoneurospora amorphoporcata TaxID=241081 RepID=A0AAN6SIL4_9PEZI|nr:mitochondrial peptidyl-tRNA hydrolase [Pseudoneurospora amorphoporcata]
MHVIPLLPIRTASVRVRQDFPPRKGASNSVGVLNRFAFSTAITTTNSRPRPQAKHQALPLHHHHRPRCRSLTTLETSTALATTMSDIPNAVPSMVVLSTSMVSLITGFVLGVYAIRGYLIPPELKEERRRHFEDPVESEESDVDEDDYILDHAPNWANGLEADQRQGLRARNTGEMRKKTKKTETPGGLDPTEECKLVLVVRTDLGMTKGKIAAQCSHATLACYKRLFSAAQLEPQSLSARLLRQWERNGQAKIAVQTKSEDEMLELMGRARSLGVTAEVIQDAGRTQIASGSRTVLGVGPAPKSLVDQITGHLKLL